MFQFGKRLNYGNSSNRAEKRAKLFWEQNLVIFLFLSFLIQTIYIPPIVGHYRLSVIELWASQYYATVTQRGILINKTIFTESRLLLSLCVSGENLKCSGSVLPVLPMLPMLPTFFNSGRDIFQKAYKHLQDSHRNSKM